MKRERLEDLGRIREKLEIINSELVDEGPFRLGPLSLDTFLEYYNCENAQLRLDRIESLYSFFYRIDDMFSEMIVIARGHEDD